MHIDFVMCKNKKPREQMWKKSQKSNASVYHACEEHKSEDPFSSEETMYYAEQVATVEKVITLEAKLLFIASSKMVMAFECSTTLVLQ